MAGEDQFMLETRAMAAFTQSLDAAIPKGITDLDFRGRQTSAFLTVTSAQKSKEPPALADLMLDINRVKRAGR